MKRKIAIVAVALAGAVAYWTTGSMDPALSQVGLNYNECVQNGLGNWFCGDAAERVQRAAEKSETPERRVKATVAAQAFMPCDNEDSWETALRVRPKSCAVYSGTNGVGATSMADGAHVVSLRWKSWAGKKAKATGLLKGERVYVPQPTGHHRP